MTMTDAGVWWLLAGGAVALELVTGTFYLLMLAIGLVAAALSAHAGLPMTTQLVVAAMVGGGAVVGWHLKREGSPKPLDASANRDVNLDIGEEVSVTAWRADGTCSVRFRGANWAAVAARAQDTADIGIFRIIAVHGSRLTITRADTPSPIGQ
jgi:membrane protein implicated in regulation of membrane protease activity